MTRAVGDNEAMIMSLDEVATLFDQAQNSVFKLMASVSIQSLSQAWFLANCLIQDSVPKFMREPKYAAILRERNLETALSGAAARSSS